jgi:hypothetical protein
MKKDRECEEANERGGREVAKLLTIEIIVIFLIDICKILRNNE